MRHLTVVAAVVAVALAVPAFASAHPSVYTSAGKVVIPGTNPVQVKDEPRYVVTNHGFTFVLKESNGATDKGVMDYKVLPSAYRQQLTPPQVLAAGDTAAQAHATCRGVAALDAEGAIRAWQGTDPFYNYVPFQTNSAGLEDKPADWLAVIKARTGVDLAAAASASAACTGLGGTYVPADAMSSSATALASGTVGEATAPLKAQIEGLNGAVAAANQAKAAAEADVARMSLALKPLRVTMAAARASAKKFASGGAAVTVTGPPLKVIALRVSISASRAAKLRLRSGVLATGNATIAANGSAQAQLKPTKAAAAALKRLKSSVGVTVEAISGDRFASARGTLTR